MTAKPPGIRLRTVGFSPRRAEPIRSLRQLLTRPILARPGLLDCRDDIYGRWPRGTRHHLDARGETAHEARWGHPQRSASMADQFESLTLED